MLQDKLLQKQHFRSAGVPVGDFCGVEDAAAVRSAVDTFGAPLMLKARRYSKACMHWQLKPAETKSSRSWCY